MKKTLAIAITMLLSIAIFFVPRASMAQPIGEIKIGIIGPQALPTHWYPSGMWAGAELAATEINASGGVYLSSGPNGAGYYSITLVKGHEHAYTGAGGTPEPAEAAAEMTRLCTIENCSIVIGGFRTEVVLPGIIPVAASTETPFLINGASTDNPQLTNASIWPFIWRVNPVNSTMLFKTIAGALGGYLIPTKLNPLFGCDLDGNPLTMNQTRIAVVTEDLAWTLPIHGALTTPSIYPTILGPWANVTYAVRVPSTASDFSTYSQAINDSKCRLVIHVFSGPAGPGFIVKLGLDQVKAMKVGINVVGQVEQYTAMVSGLNDYESILNFAGTGTPIVPGVTDVFWDNFVGNYSTWPMYTAWGGYDGVRMVAEAYEDIGSTDKNLLKTYFEDPSYQREGLNGHFKFTAGDNHDVFSNEYGPTWIQGYTRAMMVQWQVQSPTVGIMEVVCPVDQPYSKRWAIPPNMYPLVEDINYDGRVDMRDVGTAARAFGTYPGHERWEKEADINFDNVVDMRDIGSIARKFGTVVSLPVLPC
ncbi:MAG: ABC transporter substrate-binding protein [Candidatus Bathyarchaeota archaeon]|jgi:ABC-type branched-subunit amino acid transport system substrate-binding protein